MRLYLVQHGDAKLKSEDPERPLSQQGKDDVARVARSVTHAGIEVKQIRHSGKQRAQETAAIMAEHLDPSKGIAAMPGLAPKDDVHPIAEWLQRETESVMLVGHLPFLERLVGLLVTGAPGRTVVQFCQGGVVCLRCDPKTRVWSVLWAITPELVSREDTG
jgi:phosphohistidine phosphatase